MELTEEIEVKYQALAVKLGAKNPQLSVHTNGMALTLNLDEGSDTYIGGASISDFPGCCGIAILHDYSGDPKFAKLFFRLREEIAVDGDKGFLQFTDIVGCQPRFLKSLGYKIISRGFYNPNSGNRVHVWGKRISQNESRY